MFRIIPDSDEFASLQRPDELEELLSSFFGNSSLRDVWPVGASARLDKSGGRPIGDAPAWSRFPPVISPRAWEAMEGIISPHAEVLRLDVREGRQTAHYRVLNVLTVLDCLDRAKSDIEFWPDSSDIMSLDSIVLKAEHAKADLFRLSDFLTAVIVSERFRDEWERNSLTGMLFVPVQTT